MKKIIVLIIVYIAVANLYAQQVKFMPEKYLRPVDGIEKPSASDILTDKPWFVYSDRVQNPIYSYENGGSVAEYANFQDEFAVLDIPYSGNRLPLAHKSHIKGNELMAGESILGWIDVDKLLLWNNSLADREYQVEKKAMILFSFDKDNQVRNKKDFRTDVEIFDGPGSSGSSRIKYHQGMFRFFSVYKEEGDFVLLADNTRINTNDPDGQLEGWVSNEKLSMWSTRVAWEKNWHEPAVEERKMNKPVNDLVQGIMILEDKSDAIDLARINRKESVYIPEGEITWAEAKFENFRRIGPMGRFPLLEVSQIKTTDQMVGRPIKVGVIGDLENYKGDKIDYESIIKASEDLRSARKINLIFVVDATESILPYRKSIQEGIRIAMTEINQMFQKAAEKDRNNFSFGCVLYRDYAMQDSLDRFEGVLSSNIKPLFDWLDENMTKQKNKHRQGVAKDDMEEAMYMGMAYAMDHYTPNPNESNYMILIGDCGDHQDSIKRPTVFTNINEVLESLDFYQTNLLAFQANNSNHPAYDLFQTQVKEILEKHGDTVLREITKSHFQLPESSLYKGLFLTTDKGSSMKVETMEKEITQTIKQINDDVNAKVREITKFLIGESVDENDTDPWVVASIINYASKYLKDADNEDMDNDDIRELLKGMNQEYKEGYTVIKSDGYQFPYFETVVLFESKEIDEIINAFKDFVSVKTFPTSLKRQQLVKTLKDWFPKYFSGMDDDAINNMEVGKLLKAITGLEFDEIYNDITIAKVADKKQLEDKKIDAFVNDIEIKLSGLQKVYDMRKTYEARVLNAKSDDLFLYIPGSVFKSN